MSHKQESCFRYKSKNKEYVVYDIAFNYKHFSTIVEEYSKAHNIMVEYKCYNNRNEFLESLGINVSKLESVYSFKTNGQLDFIDFVKNSIIINKTFSIFRSKK